MRNFPWWRLRYVKSSLRNLIFELKNVFGLLSAKKRLSKCSSFNPLRLNLGCGKDLREGWVNLDIDTMIRSYVNPDSCTAVISIDLRHGIPLRDCSVDYIYSSHFWEHLEADDGLFLFREAARILRPGGIFRISLPDVLRCMREYVANNREFFKSADFEKRKMQPLPGILNDLDILNYAIFQAGQHKILYNTDKVTEILRSNGLINIRQGSFDPGIDVNEEIRKRYSFYISAEKAG